MYTCDDEYDGPSRGSDDETDFDDIDGDESSQRLYNLLIDLKLSGKLSAKTVTTLAFWARGAGAKGMVGSLAYSPKSTGGNAS